MTKDMFAKKYIKLYPKSNFEFVIILTFANNKTIDKNKEVRTDKDWEKQIGRAVSKN